MTIRTLAVEGFVPEPVMTGDTLWAHAATLGRYFYRDAWFELNRETVESFLRNFATGYPSKIIVDYEHDSGSDAPGPKAKAGDVVELRGVFSVADFTGDLKAAAQKVVAKNGRKLSDPENFGLWIRMRPLARSFAMIKSGEYSELSIEFHEDYLNPHTGQKQGPTLLAVALTNRPFLDRMNSIAASRRDGGPPAAPASGDSTMPNAMLLSAAAAVSGKAVATEEEAVMVLTNAGNDITRLRAFSDKLSVELGEVEPDKAFAKIRALKTENADFREKAEKAEAARVDGEVRVVMKKYEDRITPFARDNIFTPALKAELRANPQVATKDTNTVKALDGMKPHGITSQESVGDAGKGQPTDDQRLIARVRELKATDDRVKDVFTKQGPYEADNLAREIAEAELEAERIRTE